MPAAYAHSVRVLAMPIAHPQNKKETLETHKNALETGKVARMAG